MSQSDVADRRNAKIEEIDLRVLPRTTNEIFVVGASGMDMDCYAPEGGHVMVENISGGFLTPYDSSHIYVDLGHKPKESSVQTCEISLSRAQYVRAKGPFGERTFGRL